MIPFLFVLAMIALFLQSVIFPQFILLPFAPWIALVILSSPMPKCLWLSFFAGACMDLLSDDPIGLHALNYTVISFLLFRFRNHFLYDTPLHLGLFTTFFSSLSTLLQLFLLFLFEKRVPFSISSVLLDLFCMPLADGVYALLWVSLPLLAYKKLRHLFDLYWLSTGQKIK